MKSIFLTGGAGFFGSILKSHVLRSGHRCVSIDLCKDEDSHPNLTSIQGDIRDTSLLDEIYKDNSFNAVFHCAAILAHAVKDKKFLWESNVDGTRNVAAMAKKYGVPQLVFTSSNCLWARNFGRPVVESDTPDPIEVYGRSKWEAERILHGYSNDLQTAIIRCPTIIDSGRLGLLSILFEFIHESRRVWVVGGGQNRYQFIYAQDLADAFMRCLEYGRSETFNIGSDNVKSLREVFAYVIEKAGSNSRITSLPRLPALLGMRFAYHAGISPLGPYHYKMIAEDFEFDTSRIKHELNWQPTLTDEEMLFRAYEYYMLNHSDLQNRASMSAHKQPAAMGVIRLLKWIS